MPAADPVLLRLDRDRALRWTDRADARLSRHGLNFFSAGRQLATPRGLWALCALVWSALEDREHPFAEPEDIASHLKHPDAQVAALRAVERIGQEAGLLLEKKTTATACAPSAPGPSPSSSSAPRRRRRKP